MHIAFVSTMGSEPWGGSEELWSRSAARLRSQALDVSVLVRKWPVVPAGIQALLAQGIPVSFLGEPSTAQRVFSRLLGRNAAAPYRKHLRRSRPDFVVISQGATMEGISCMLACAQLEIPYAPIVQANSELWWPHDTVRDEWISAYRRARHLFFVSARNAELLEDQLGIRLPNRTIVFNPWNVRIEDSVSWPATGEEMRLACVARLDLQAKGQDVLLRALASSPSLSQAIHVSFYGNGGYLAGLRSLAVHLRVPHVSFEGHVSDINAIWAKHHMLVLPSRLEGSPLALIEAMWCGRPAIVTDVGGNTELCEDNVTGFVCRAPAVSLLAETLERACSNKARWASMGMAARRQIEAIAPGDPVGRFCDALSACLR